MKTYPSIKLKFPRLLFVSQDTTTQLVWGDIVGNIQNQTDLIQLINSTIDLSTLGHNLIQAIGEDTLHNDTTRLNVQVIDPQTGGTFNYNIDLQLASATKGGQMPKESFQQIQQNTTDIAQLQGIGTVWTTTQALPQSASQSDILTAYQSVSGNTQPNPNDSLISLNPSTMNYEWTWIQAQNQWVFRGQSNVSLQTNSTPGIVQGQNVNGKIFVENDGTMSLVGYETVPPMIKSIFASSPTVFHMTTTKNQNVSVLQFSNGTLLNVTPTTIVGNTFTTFTLTSGFTTDFVVILS